MRNSDFPKIFRDELTTLQVNLGYKCNQACSHCHVDAGPNRLEMMDINTIKLIPKFIDLYNVKCLDLTGGAPELHDYFRYLIEEASQRGIRVIDRCNLTILSEPGQEDLGSFLAKYKVIVVASLPCYMEDNVDKQRGKGVFNKSINGLKELNSLGYGKENSNLELNLVYNPIGAALAPPQIALEENYRKILFKEYGIVFSSLYTITNMPINRFATSLKTSGKLDDYNKLLRDSYNKNNLKEVMCRSLISVDWKGEIYDCDFNQQLGLRVKDHNLNLNSLVKLKQNLKGKEITVGNHCYGCTAGAGSSCSGQLT